LVNPGQNCSSKWSNILTGSAMERQSESQTPSRSGVLERARGASDGPDRGHTETEFGPEEIDAAYAKIGAAVDSAALADKLARIRVEAVRPGLDLAGDAGVGAESAKSVSELSDDVGGRVAESLAASEVDGVRRALDADLKTEEIQEASEAGRDHEAAENATATSRSIAVVPRGPSTCVARNTGCPVFAAMSNADLHLHIGKNVEECKGHYTALQKAILESLYPALLEMESRYEKQQGARSDLHELLAQTWHEYLVSVGLPPGTFRSMKSRMNSALKQLQATTDPLAKPRSRSQQPAKSTGVDSAEDVGDGPGFRYGYEVDLDWLKASFLKRFEKYDGEKQCGAIRAVCEVAGIDLRSLLGETSPGLMPKPVEGETSPTIDQDVNQVSAA